VKAFRELLFPLIAVLCAFAVGAVVVLLIGDSPIETFRLLLGSAFSWPDGIGYTLFFATPLIFTGLAVAVALRGGLLNIGAEGQLYVAAFATAWTGITFAGLPAAVLVPLCCLAGIAAGAAWAAIPGLLKARFGSHEVINTIMLNFIAVALVGYLTQYHYRLPGDPIMETAPIGGGAHIARLGQFVPGLAGTYSAQCGVSLALLASWLVYILLWKTKWGYEIAPQVRTRRRRNTEASPSEGESC
jgi:simple sugar transport system permease protein